MGGNYQKDLYKQLMEVLAKVDSLEAGQKQNHKEIERMKRILNNDSSNASNPPSKDEGVKPANTYNGRKSTARKPGAQKGHKGSGLSKTAVEEKIHRGIYKHRIEEVGTPGR